MQETVAVGRGDRLRVHGLLQIARERVDALGLAGLEHVARDAKLRCRHAWRGVACDDAAAVVDPREDLQLRVLHGHRLRAAHEFFGIDFLVGDVARQAHELLLAFEQAQAYTLLRVFDVAAHGFVLAVHFFEAQIPERHCDRGEEQHDRSDGCEHREAILAQRRLAAPPAAPPKRRGRFRGFGCSRGYGYGVLHQLASVGVASGFP